MSDVSEHSDSEFYHTQKKSPVVNYDKMLIDWVRYGARTLPRSGHVPWPQAKYFPIRPSHSVNKYILLDRKGKTCLDVCGLLAKPLQAFLHGGTNFCDP